MFLKFAKQFFVKYTFSLRMSCFLRQRRWVEDICQWIRCPLEQRALHIAFMIKQKPEMAFLAREQFLATLGNYDDAHYDHEREKSIYNTPVFKKRFLCLFPLGYQGWKVICSVFSKTTIKDMFDIEPPKKEWRFVLVDLFYRQTVLLTFELLIWLKDRQYLSERDIIFICERNMTCGVAVRDMEYICRLFQDLLPNSSSYILQLFDLFNNYLGRIAISSSHKDRLPVDVTSMYKGMFLKIPVEKQLGSFSALWRRNQELAFSLVQNDEDIVKCFDESLFVSYLLAKDVNVSDRNVEFWVTERREFVQRCLVGLQEESKKSRLQSILYKYPSFIPLIFQQLRWKHVRGMSMLRFHIDDICAIVCQSSWGEKEKYKILSKMDPTIFCCNSSCLQRDNVQRMTCILCQQRHRCASCDITCEIDLSPSVNNVAPKNYQSIFKEHVVRPIQSWLNRFYQTFDKGKELLQNQEKQYILVQIVCDLDITNNKCWVSCPNLDLLPTADQIRLDVHYKKFSHTYDCSFHRRRVMFDE
eukprot:GILJ01012313.1.p1 GENE.GILJ01012313.1~~GILJ01012313.1.p1  ORF type:complete len:528 (+),score=55.12 GILJ01012313.1:3830-5413(+)